jgi:hypothetical protein
MIDVERVQVITIGIVDEVVITRGLTVRIGWVDLVVRTGTDKLDS